MRFRIILFIFLITYLFSGVFIAYFQSTDSVSFKDIQKEIILNHGAVSKEVSKLMSENYENLFVNLYKERNNLYSDRNAQTFLNIFEILFSSIFFSTFP